MLVVRDTQLTAMEDLGLQAFADSVRAYLGRKYPVGPGSQDVSRLVSISISTCLAHGYEQEGAIMEFAEAMLMNIHDPLSAGDLEKAAETVLREFKARNVLEQLVALKAADGQTISAGPGHAPSAEETGA